MTRAIALISSCPQGTTEYIELRSLQGSWKEYIQVSSPFQVEEYIQTSILGCNFTPHITGIGLYGDV